MYEATIKKFILFNVNAPHKLAGRWFDDVVDYYMDGVCEQGFGWFCKGFDNRAVGSR